VSDDWDLGRHLQEGRRAISDIRAKGMAGQRSPVCHHFSSHLDNVAVDFSEHFGPLIDTFREFGIEFDPSSLEAWEQIAPDEEWLGIRIPQMLALASRDDLRYQGWSYEPAHAQPVNATDFVILRAGG
jgi:hypothetical protein